MSSYLSKVIPLARARSSSPMVSMTPSGGIGISGASHRAALRAHYNISPLSAILTSHSDHALFGVPRGYATAAFAGGGVGGGDVSLFGLDRFGEVGGGKKSKASLTRSMSDVAVPDPPTSNHLHKAIPGATGKLFYTET
jgi:hypothetical protein